jgi:hypothetical protein
MNFRKTFAAVFLAILLAAGVIWIVVDYAKHRKAGEEARALIFEMAQHTDSLDWETHRSKYDPDGKTLLDHGETIRAAYKRGDPLPPEFPKDRKD